MFDYSALKKYLDDNGYKQKFIAQKVEVSEATLSLILLGKAKCPLETYVSICQVLAVPFGKFINVPNIAA